ncbi:MAG: hypothetical protein JNK54_01485 [Elusimicrobia bacterium]|nr:hypothetical protein [Elusimicrobiota bacterium]
MKPWTPVGGIRWREELSPHLGFQTQYWANRSAYYAEFGNSAGTHLAQEGQARLSLQSLWVDFRRPLVGSSIEGVLGMNGAYQSLRQKNIVFQGNPEPGASREIHAALGAHLGFHGKGVSHPWARGPGLFWDGEILLGHYLWTKNRLTSEDGSIRRGGYTYALRMEGGLAWERWRLSLGYTRQLYEILVPGGRRFTPGTSSSATASLPINKTDLFGAFLALGWTY